MIPNVGVYSGEVFDWNGDEIGLFHFDLVTVIINFCNGSGSLLVCHKALHKISGRSGAQLQTVAAKIEGIKNSLDPYRVKAVAIFHFAFYSSYRAVQRGKAGAHFCDVGFVFCRHGDWKHPAVEGVIYRGVVVACHAGHE